MWNGAGEVIADHFGGLLVFIDQDMIPLARLPRDTLYDFDIITNKSIRHGEAYTVERLRTKLAYTSCSREIRYLRAKVHQKTEEGGKR